MCVYVCIPMCERERGVEGIETPRAERVRAILAFAKAVVVTTIGAGGTAGPVN